MKRNALRALLEWKVDSRRLPLVLRGARQVGKSHLVQAFANEYFASQLVINFERSPQYKSCFEVFDPKTICKQLELLTGQLITPGETLLFLDEIQECPKALQALRYFKEEMPELHVIGAGSLLEFVLADQAFSMPVGRVQFLYLTPLSFAEFLQASGDEKLVAYVQEHDPRQVLPQAIHQKLLASVKTYCWVGGMPAAVATYLESNSLEKTTRMQASLLETYRADFNKYGKHHELSRLQLLFDQLPRVATQQLKYSKIDADIPSRDLKSALDKLVKAGLTHRVLHTSASGLPLGATVNERKFKTVFVDVGLWVCANRIDPQHWLEQDALFLLQGAMWEQLVGQELLAYQDAFMRPELFFWSREEKSSQAEVDYVMAIHNTIVPIEVKSTSIGHLKSLKRFLEEKHSLLGVRISENPFSLHDRVLSVPLYAVFALPHYWAFAQ